MKKRWLRSLAVMMVGMPLFSCLIGVRSLRSEEKTIWQIGNFDESSEEFGASFGIAPTAAVQPDPVFRIGQSDPKKDWPGFHPGSANGQAGGREHPFVVVFSLNEPPRGVYTLTIGTLPYMPRRPNLRVDANGKQGVLYLRPTISYDRGNFPVAFIPQYSYQKLEIDLPASYFRRGENRLTLTAVDDPPERDNAGGTVGAGISGVFYDALRLSQDATKHFSPAEVTATVTPTVFYMQKEARLVEVVEAIVRLNRKPAVGRAVLELGGQRYTAPLTPGSDFGEQRVEFEIPEWTGPAKARLRVEAGGARNFGVTLEPARKWTVFVVPHTHLDVGYTDYQGKVAEGQPRVITQAADLIRQNPDFRFSIDGSWNLEQFLATRSVEKREEILNLARQGKIALPAQYCNVLTGYASLETLIRSLYPSRALARQYGLPFEYANITDVPSYSGSYPSVLASAGVKYFVAAGNNWRAPFLLYGHWNEKSPFWWEGPDGKKVLFWYSRHYMQVQSLFGLPPRLAGVRDSIPVYLQAYSRPQYKPDAVLIYGTQVENTDLFPETATFLPAWNREYAYPRLRYATFADFFKYLDDHFSSQFETYRGDGGPYWEDGVAGDAYFVTIDRENQNRALSAEVLSTIPHVLDPALQAPKALVDDIWRNLVLFAEHTWTAWNSMTMPDHEQAVKQLEVKDSRATQAHLEIEDLVHRSMSQLADQIHVPSNTLVVFNSLNWRRDALVETDLFERALLKDLSTGRNLPYEVLAKKEGFLHARFLAEDIPSVGYKCYEISHAEGGPAAPPALETTREHAVENAFYRVTLDPARGAVSSIFDKELKREIVDDHSPYKFNQYLYVTGGDGPTQLMRPVKVWPLAELKVHPASAGEIVGVTKTAFGHSVRLRSSAPNTPAVNTEILLFDKEKKIEFINRVDKQPVLAKEGVYFAFPVAVRTPEFLYTVQNGWVNPARDLMKGATLEWFNIQAWMAVRDEQLTVGIVPVDAPLASFGDINRGVWPAEFRPQSSTIFSYVMNNYWDTNYRAAQGGTFTFRYVVTSRRDFDPGALARLGWEHMRPVELNYVTPQDKVGNPERPLPAEGSSFMEIDAPNIVLETWKLAEDGDGTILRLYEIAGRETTAALQFTRYQVSAASRCTAVEDNLESLGVNGQSVRLDFHPHEIVTVRVR